MTRSEREKRTAIQRLKQRADLPPDTGGVPHYLSEAEVMVLTGMSRATLHREVKEHRFPAPVYLTGNRGRKGWRSTDLVEWDRTLLPAS